MKSDGNKKSRTRRIILQKMYYICSKVKNIINKIDYGSQEIKKSKS